MTALVVSMPQQRLLARWLHHKDPLQICVMQTPIHRRFGMLPPFGNLGSPLFGTSVRRLQMCCGPFLALRSIQGGLFRSARCKTQTMARTGSLCDGWGAMCIQARGQWFRYRAAAVQLLALQFGTTPRWRRRSRRQLGLFRNGRTCQVTGGTGINRTQLAHRCCAKIDC